MDGAACGVVWCGPAVATVVTAPVTRVRRSHVRRVDARDWCMDAFRHPPTHATPPPTHSLVPGAAASHTLGT